MKKIKLTQTKEALVDDEDFKTLDKFKWCYNRGYAVRSVYGEEKQMVAYMHREIMNTPKGMDTDHINHDKLDNRKENLRICTTSQNTQNRKAKGIHWDKRDKKWKIQLMCRGEKINLGYHSNKKEALKIRQEAENKYFGEFAFSG